MSKLLRRLGTVGVLMLVLGTLGVQAAWAVPPANDNFVDAIAVTSPSTTSGTNVDATTETGEPTTCGFVSFSKTVWYSITPASSATLVIDTFTSSFDTVLAAYTGPGLGSLASVACNDDTSGLQSKITISVTGGETYWLQISRFGTTGAGGAITLNVAGFVPVAHDNFAEAAPIGSSPYTDSRSTAGATTEAGEPLPCGAIGRTVWYRYDATDPGLHAVSTAGSNYDSAMAVYSGTSLADLVLIDCNDDAGVYPIHAQSMVGFVAEPGTSYFIQVGGYGGATGDLELRMSFGLHITDTELTGSSAGAMIDPEQLEAEANTIAGGGSVVVRDGAVEEAYACAFAVVAGACTP